MAQKGFFYDMTTCIGCKVCQISCKDKNNLEVGVDFRKVEYYEDGKYPTPNCYYISMACNHCGQPKCVEACPAQALSKREDNGLVIHDKEKCIGCRACEKACPYNAIHFIPEEKKIGKCDGCIGLLEKGDKPACVTGCVMRALDFDDIEILGSKYGTDGDLSNLSDIGSTNPSMLIKRRK